MKKFLSDINLNIIINEREFAQIPKEGPFIILVNRFSHYIEEIAVIEILKEIRPDIKVLTFNRNTKENENAIYVRDYARTWSKVREDYVNEIKRANKEDIPIAIFPGRRISKIDFEKFGWDKEIIKTVYLSKIPVITMYCNWGAKLDTPLGFVIPDIYFEKNEDKELIVRIGKPIIPDQIEFIKNAEMYRKYIFAKIFSLGKSIRIDSFFAKGDPVNDELIKDVATELIEKDINSLPQEALVCTKGNLKTYLANPFQLPNALTKIGILRAQTFRDVNEGTGKSIDIDEFDVFYYQLIIWDDSKKKIVGGCRLAFADWVIQYYGKKGLYTNSLFQYDSKMNKILFQSIEIGRLYITPQYQKTKNSLLIVWESLREISIKNPQYKYFLGITSISKDYSNYTKKLITHFLRQHYFNQEIATHITSRNPFLFRLTKDEKESLLKINDDKDSEMFDKLIEELEPKHSKLSFIIKEYLKQKAKFLGFTIDNTFSDTLDGLIIMKIDEMTANIAKITK